MKKIKIGNSYIGHNEKLYFIADIAANHDGDLNRAFKLIELAHEAGIDIYEVIGSGDGGRILAEDVRKFIEELKENSNEIEVHEVVHKRSK